MSQQTSYVWAESTILNAIKELISRSVKLSTGYSMAPMGRRMVGWCAGWVGVCAVLLLIVGVFAASRAPPVVLPAD